MSNHSELLTAVRDALAAIHGPAVSVAPPSPRVLSLRKQLLQDQPELTVHGTGSSLPNRSRR